MIFIKMISNFRYGQVCICDGDTSDGPWRQRRALRLAGLLPVSAARSAVTLRTASGRLTGADTNTHTQTTRPDPRAKMSNFSNKFGAYTMTQLNEILEDDDKLTKMVHEMDEVG